MSFTNKVDTRTLSLVLIALIGGVIGGYISGATFNDTKIDNMSNAFITKLDSKETEISSLSKTVSDLGTQVSQLENNIVDIASLEAPDNAEVLAALDQLRDEQYILHELTWDNIHPFIEFPTGTHSIEITSSEPFEVKSVAVYFQDPDRAMQFSFFKIGPGNYLTETYSPSSSNAFYTNLFSDMKVNMPPTIPAGGSLKIDFTVAYVDSMVPDGDEFFHVVVMLESPRQAITELEIQLNS